jgi:hypothetical protein
VFSFHGFLGALNAFAVLNWFRRDSDPSGFVSIATPVPKEKTWKPYRLVYLKTARVDRSFSRGTGTEQEPEEEGSPG